MNNYWTAALNGLIQAAQNPVPDVKPGTKSTEFWLTSIGSVALPVAMQVGAVNPTAGAVSAALIAVYTIARSFVKAQQATAAGNAAGTAALAAPPAPPADVPPAIPVQPAPAVVQ